MSDVASGRAARATVELVDRVLLVRLSHVVTAHGLAELAVELAIKYRQQARAFVIDFRASAFACASWELEAISDPTAIALPGVFVAEGVVHDALRLHALRRAAAGASRWVTADWAVAVETAKRLARPSAI